MELACCVNHRITYNLVHDDGHRHWKDVLRKITLIGEYTQTLPKKFKPPERSYLKTWTTGPPKSEEIVNPLPLTPPPIKGELGGRIHFFQSHYLRWIDGG